MWPRGPALLRSGGGLGAHIVAREGGVKAREKVLVWAHRSHAREALALVAKLRERGLAAYYRDTRNYRGEVEKCDRVATNHMGVAAAYGAVGIPVDPMDDLVDAWHVPPDRWATETVYIIGGGPSAGKVNFAKLRGIVIAVNDSGRLLPDADVLFTADLHWVRSRLPLIESFAGDVVVAMPLNPRRVGALHPIPSRCWRVKRRGDHNSGLEALYWAADMGARRIVLVGFDLKRPAHWHGGYEWVHRPEMSPTVQYPQWVGCFAEAAVEMQERGVEVLNANRQSAIRSFPFTKVPHKRVKR